MQSLILATGIGGIVCFFLATPIGFGSLFLDGSWVGGWIMFLLGPLLLLLTWVLHTYYPPLPRNGGLTGGIRLSSQGGFVSTPNGGIDTRGQVTTTPPPRVRQTLDPSRTWLRLIAEDQYGRLWEARDRADDRHGNPHWIEVKDMGGTHWIRTDPRHKTPKAAIAASYGLAEKDYQPNVRG